LLSTPEIKSSGSKKMKIVDEIKDDGFVERQDSAFTNNSLFEVPEL
jgi:hypothetical protein